MAFLAVIQPMPNFVAYTAVDGVALLTVNNPPVNALSPGVPEALQAGIAQAVADDGITAIVIIGGGRTFIAGADISNLEEAAWEDPSKAIDLHQLLIGRILGMCGNAVGKTNRQSDEQ